MDSLHCWSFVVGITGTTGQYCGNFAHALIKTLNRQLLHILQRSDRNIFIRCTLPVPKICYFWKRHGPLTRYVKLRLAHAPRMPRTLSPPPRLSDPDMHHCTCVMYVLWCIPGSLTSGFLWSRWLTWYSRQMCNPQCYVSGKRPITIMIYWTYQYNDMQQVSGGIWNMHFL